MLHVLICTDPPDRAMLRMANREAHPAHLRADIRVLQAGPFGDPAGRMSGPLVAFDTDDRTHVGAVVAGDPHGRAGLVAEVRIEAWNRVIEA